jgi:hypothetical protein
MFFRDKKELSDALRNYVPFDFDLVPTVEILDNNYKAAISIPTKDIMLESIVGSSLATNLPSLTMVTACGNFCIITWLNVLPLTITVTNWGAHQSAALLNSTGYNLPATPVDLVTAGAVTSVGNQFFLGLNYVGNSSSVQAFILPCGCSITTTTAPYNTQYGLYTYVKPAVGMTSPNNFNLCLNHQLRYGTVYSSSAAGVNLYLARPYADFKTNSQPVHTFPQSAIPEVLFSAYCSINFSNAQQAVNFTGYNIVPFSSASSENLPPIVVTTLP